MVLAYWARHGTNASLLRTIQKGGCMVLCKILYEWIEYILNSEHCRGDLTQIHLNDCHCATLPTFLLFVKFGSNAWNISVICQQLSYTNLHVYRGYKCVYNKSHTVSDKSWYANISLFSWIFKWLRIVPQCAFLQH